MKKYIFIIAASLIATLTYAQSNKEEIDLMQPHLLSPYNYRGIFDLIRY
jgi:hypothetical protein